MPTGDQRCSRCGAWVQQCVCEADYHDTVYQKGVYDSWKSGSMVGSLRMIPDNTKQLEKIKERLKSIEESLEKIANFTSGYICFACGGNIATCIHSGNH